VEGQETGVRVGGRLQDAHALEHGKVQLAERRVARLGEVPALISGAAD
jgi:hypothetical protein